MLGFPQYSAIHHSIIDELSKNIVVYVFTAPGIQGEHVSKGIQLALEILQQFGGGKDPWQKVFNP